MSINKQIRAIAEDHANTFDSTLLHNRVYGAIQGQHETEHDLQHYLELKESLHELAEDHDDLDRGSDFSRAARSLDDHVDGIVEEIIARELDDLLAEIDDWCRHGDEKKEAAKHEAREWLQAYQHETEHAKEQERKREEPDRSEPADFGGGESTGVQDL